MKHHPLLVLAAMAGLCQGQVRVDTSFNPNLPPAEASGYEIIDIGASDQIYVNNYDTGTLNRLSPNGVVDTSFNPAVSSHIGNNSGYFDGIQEEPDGKIVVSGSFGENGQQTLLTRLLSSGAADPAFNRVAAPRDDIYDAWGNRTTMGDWQIDYYGFDNESFTDFSGTLLARSDGQLVPGFPPAGENVFAWEQYDDGKWIVGGTPVLVNGQERTLARFLTDYQLDTEFNAPVFNDAGDSLEIDVWDWDGGYFLILRFDAGDVTTDGQPAGNIYRLLPDGSVDPAFTPYLAPVPWVSLEEISDPADPSDEKLLVYTDSVTSTGFHILDAETGQVDPSFNPVLELPDTYGEFVEDDKVRVSFDTTDGTVNGTPVPAGAEAVILNPDGSIDHFEMASPFPEFQYFDSELGALAPVIDTYRDWLDDDSVLVTGSDPAFTHIDGVPAEGIVRVLADGTVDETFHIVPSYPPFYQYVRSWQTSPTEVLLSGNFTSINGEPMPGLARIILDAVGLPPEWIHSYGLTDDPVLLASEDSDGDGISDLSELAFRLNPLKADAGTLAAGEGSGLPAVSLSADGPDGRLRLAFPRRRDRADLGLTYEARFSSTLHGDWTPGTEVGTTPVNETWEIVTVDDIMSKSESDERFGQVKVGL